MSAPSVCVPRLVCGHNNNTLLLAGLETTAFAVLAGFSNYGSSVAGYFGAFLFEPFGLDTINGMPTTATAVHVPAPLLFWNTIYKVGL